MTAGQSQSITDLYYKTVLSLSNISRTNYCLRNRIFRLNFFIYLPIYLSIYLFTLLLTSLDVIQNENPMASVNSCYKQKDLYSKF